MDREKVKQLESEIEEINRVPDEGENLDTVDGFRKFAEKQLDKIRGKDKKKASQASEHTMASGAQAKGQGDQDAFDIYDFNYPERGLAIIINNENFSLTEEFGDRPGSNHDAAALYQTFKNLGFKVWVKKDLTAWQMVEVLRLGKDHYDHASADCFVCAILSHGNETLVTTENKRRGSSVRHDLLFGIDGKAVATSDVVGFFSDRVCPGLSGKPRLFFIQACRGIKIDDGVEISTVKETNPSKKSGRQGRDGTDGRSCINQPDRPLTDHQTSVSGIDNTLEFKPLYTDTTDAKSGSTEEVSGEGIHRISLNSQSTSGADTDVTDAKGVPIRDSPVRDVPVYPAPLYKDGLIMYATPPGHYAWRRKNGAWFVQTLCGVLDSPEIGQKSLLHALVQVVGRVARDYQSENPNWVSMHQKKETPVIESMLVKDIFLTRK